MVQARADVLAQLRCEGYALLRPGLAQAALGIHPAALADLKASWEELPRDTYLRDAGRYRSRRHSCFIQSLPAATLADVPPRAHWQPTAYNALHGGLQRWFEPIEAAAAEAPAWLQLLGALGALFAQLKPV